MDAVHTLGINNANTSNIVVTGVVFLSLNTECSVFDTSGYRCDGEILSITNISQQGVNASAALEAVVGIQGVAVIVDEGNERICIGGAN
ncbi:MAG: hypothetical protein KA045_01385 [Burkholderiaceae bacterium]|nr:hypothetical protein [Burkholderiaceae bacterium]